MCSKSTTRDPGLYFPSEGSHTQDFYALKKSIEPTNLSSRGEYDDHWTTGVDVYVSVALSILSYLLSYTFPDFPYYVTLRTRKRKHRERKERKNN